MKLNQSYINYNALRNAVKAVHVGSLLLHRAINYEKARTSQWIRIRACINNASNTSAKNTMIAVDDYYVHGLTGESVYETPIELMTAEEKALKKAFDKTQRKLEDSVQSLEKLQYEIEKFKFERDTMLEDLAHEKEHGGKKKKEMNANNAVNMNNNGANNEKKGLLAGVSALTTGIDLQYKDMLLKPSDRRRGQGRTDYLKSLLESSKDGTTT
eukprot:CAMPEP_0170117724 /NCGR_PEP_ID=MMETSP0020_2-20130122/13182_1 /TAXON_ID=98059 /ORGANISM="Dinobryon sp., Strain UTEXLB2267" /LENGTH=212 /DNA_ID=CAMNT_0010346381 /DNA_START=975 /DNA_END=1613 /DNA_ORIENTATION=-